MTNRSNLVALTKANNEAWAKVQSLISKAQFADARRDGSSFDDFVPLINRVEAKAKAIRAEWTAAVAGLSATEIASLMIEAA